MSMMQGSISVAANTIVDDVLVNNILAIARRTEGVEYGLSGSAIGLILDLFVGTNDVAPGLVPNVLGATPTFPQDYLGAFGVVSGDRISLRANNTTVGALTLFFAFRFTPIG